MRGILGWSLVVMLGGWVARGGAAEPAAALPQVVRTELFAAMDQEQLSVHVVAHNFSRLTLNVRNRTENTLEVALPAVFSAVPRLGTRSAAADRNRSNRTVDRTGQGAANEPHLPGSARGFGTMTAQSQLPQGLGGSLAYSLDQDEQTRRPRRGADDDNHEGEPAEGGPTIAAAPQSWTLQPRERRSFNLPCFCLEYGKPDPSRGITYDLRPLDDLTGKPAVRELLERFGRGDIEQRVAQLAAWHVANGVPWPQLAQMRLGGSYRQGRRTFSVEELQAARQLAESLPSYVAPDSMSSGHR